MKVYLKLLIKINNKDLNCAASSRKFRGRPASSKTNPKMGCTGHRFKLPGNYQVILW